ncbi:MAG: ribosomal L7Ae/L30e/S12e/Gadd45 family protein [Candidatus Cloacimonas sp.]
MNPKIITLMQFARKAGKLVSGFDACERSLNKKNIALVILAEDSSERTKEKIKKYAETTGNRNKIIETGNQIEISAALGLPLTGVFGITDKSFAGKIMEYWLSETERRKH